MKGDKKFKATNLLEPKAATAPIPFMPKGKIRSQESMMKEMARSRAAKKGY